jgi:hypothetical protein
MVQPFVVIKRRPSRRSQSLQTVLDHLLSTQLLQRLLAAFGMCGDFWILVMSHRAVQVGAQ